jgi:hypothetical protein
VTNLTSEPGQRSFLAAPAVISTSVLPLYTAKLIIPAMTYTNKRNKTGTQQIHNVQSSPHMMLAETKTQLSFCSTQAASVHSAAKMQV